MKKKIITIISLFVTISLIGSFMYFSSRPVHPSSVAITHVEFSDDAITVRGTFTNGFSFYKGYNSYLEDRTLFLKIKGGLSLLGLFGIGSGDADIVIQNINDNDIDRIVVLDNNGNEKQVWPE